MLLMLATLTSCESAKTPTTSIAQEQRLYGLPDAMPIAKGTEIRTKNGIVVAPEDTTVWSAGAMKKQVERSFRTQ